MVAWLAVGGVYTRCLPPPHPQYNEGWNRKACTACDSAGGNITTDDVGSTSSDDCITLAGYSSSRLASGGFTGAICPADTYGRPANTSGLVEVAW